MRRLLLLVFLSMGYFMHAQYGKNCEIRQFKLNIFNPGIEYEMAVGVNSTLDFRVAWQAALEPASATPLEDFDFFPAITVQNRYYHNLHSRERRRRSIYGNSGNYLAPSAAIFSPGKRTVDGQIVDGVHGYGGLVYGIQRSYDSGFSFSIDAGAGYYVGPFKGAIHPVVNLSIGWIISEKRWCVGL
ncbi:hypothetical protein [Flagellimonas zhangzhouensis]|uniref:DUF3575 domain-containing protein n=1 Tax=Flagellimonas zhangzhouensis TaxID=1073328 RepID=A0A1H2QHA6_9FLAO|nr:hypothetical protein [Allomuricauda zhangzhouensis]SDQ52521.1 hypothetical protein SAMN05216294_1553 [Allomuricauda zhangzhouensis]SDW05829.1 hypothetical protein SAMN04487892_0204 [Allomuricauda zhangzhouensis]